MSRFLLWGGLILMCGLGACLDEINLETPNEVNRKLVVQATLVKGNPSVASAYLSYSGNYEAIETPPPVLGATVELQDENNQALRLQEIGEGRYELAIPEGSSPIPIEFGKAYQLLIRTGEGLQYESGMETLYEVPRIDTIDTEIELRQELNELENIVNKLYLNVYVKTPLTPVLNGERVGLKWDFSGVYQYVELANPDDPFEPVNTCYITESVGLERISIFNGREVNTSEIDRYFILEKEINHRFALGYYLFIFQQSLSPGAQTYWDQAQQVIERNGNFFETPVGPITGNIHNIADPQEEVLGYFYATDIDTARFFISPEAAGTPRLYCNQFSNYEESDPSCKDCLIFPNSTLQRPPYWR